MAYKQDALKIIQEPSTSKWLVEAIRTMANRDPLDALKDAEILKELMTARFAEAIQGIK